MIRELLLALKGDEGLIYQLYDTHVRGRGDGDRGAIDRGAIDREVLGEPRVNPSVPLMQDAEVGMCREVLSLAQYYVHLKSFVIRHDISDEDLAATGYRHEDTKGGGKLTSTYLFYRK